MVKNNILAKSNGIGLIEHSVNVAKLSKHLIEQITNDEDIISCVVISSLFHDIGKCTNGFQKHLMDNNYEDYIPHNILSSAIIYNCLDINGDNGFRLNTIIRSVLYHHPTKFRTFIFNTIKDKSLNDYSLSNIEKENIENIINELLNIYESFGCKLKLYKRDKDSILSDISDGYFVDGKIKDINFFIISNVVKFADFLVSSGIDESIYINGNYPSDIIFTKPQFYDDRFNKQMEFAEECSKYRLSLFNTQTGFGKTLMGIKYLLNNGKKGYWICPRNTIAEGLYQTITKELKLLGLDSIVSVGLLLTNEWIEGNDKCDIIVTNIDNFVRPFLKRESKEYSYNMLYCNCIFDEFHEYVDDQALMSLFNIILNSRFLCNNSKTLLLSATPIMNFVENFKNSKDFKYLEYKYEPILSKQIKISYSDSLNIDNLNNQNWLISVNAVNTSQKIYKNNVVDNIIHSRFTETDLKERLKQLYNEHSKGKKIHTSWVATNIISTGIDVSFSNMLLSLPTPERFIQNGGRCNRWNECSEIPIWHITRDNKDKSERYAVDSFSNANFASKFYDFLTSEIKNNSIITLKTIYDKRDEFYIKEKDLFDDIFKQTLNKSIENLKKLSYEYSFHFQDDNKKTKYISNKCNARKDDKTISFFFKVKDYSTKEFIKDVIQGDDRIIDLNILQTDTSIEYMYKAIKENFKDYVKTLKQLDNIRNKGSINFLKYFFNKANCNETPLLIGNEYYYDKEIGLYKKDKIKC